MINWKNLWARKGLKAEETGTALVLKKEKRSDASHQRHEQLRYLSQATYLEEAGSPTFAVHTVFVISALVLAFVFWASWARINEVARTAGMVVPAGFEQIVQHLDGGIVRSIQVKSGEHVEKDQVLLVIDDGTTVDELERLRAKQAFLKANVERLRSILEDRTPNFSSAINANADDIAAQSLLFKTTLREQKTHEDILLQQIDQKEKEVGILKGRKETLQKRLVSIRNVYEARKKLLNKGLVSVSVFAQSEQEYFRMEGEIVDLTDRIEQAKVSIGEYQSKFQKLRHTARLALSKDLNSTVTELRQVESAMQLLERRHARLKIRSPVRGLVKDLRINTIGSVLKKGEFVLSVVPIDEELVIETKINPSDIGNVSPGQKVKVKVSAYDFSRFGSVTGTLERISASSFADEDGAQYYKARIKLSKTFVGNNPNRNKIIPGMSVMADVITGDKTILDYLLKPIRVAASTAFTER